MKDPPMSGCYAVFHKQLGDLVLLQPALEKLADRHAGSVHLLTRTGHEPLIQLMPGVKMSRGMTWTPRRALYCFDSNSKSAFRSLFIPAFRRTCILPDQNESRWYHSLIFGALTAPGLRDQYVAEYYWSALSVSKKDKLFTPPRLNLPPEDWRPSWYKEEKHILINPTAGWKRKSWQASRWAHCLNALAESRPETFIMTSGQEPWQIAHCEKIMRKSTMGKKLISAPHTSLREYLWLCANARAVLTVDGSAAHFAAAFSIPSLALFGPTCLANWHKEGPLTKAIQAPVSSNDGVHHLRNLDTPPVLDACLALFSQITGDAQV